MTVCKCDRCGKYVDEQELPRVRGRIHPVRQIFDSDDITVDLCPECYALLREFLGYHDYKHEEDEEISIDELKDMLSAVTGVPRSILEKKEEE